MMDITSLALMQTPYYYGFCCGAALVAWIALAIWVYRDAEERDMASVLWGIGALITGPVVLVVYLLVRSEKPLKYAVRVEYPPQVAPPPQTHQMQPPVRFTPAKQNYCIRCGRRLSEKSYKCPVCDE